MKEVSRSLGRFTLIGYSPLSRRFSDSVRIIKRRRGRKRQTDKETAETKPLLRYVEISSHTRVTEMGNQGAEDSLAQSLATPSPKQGFKECVDRF